MLKLKDFYIESLPEISARPDVTLTVSRFVLEDDSNHDFVRARGGVDDPETKRAFTFCAPPFFVNLDLREPEHIFENVRSLIWRKCLGLFVYKRYDPKGIVLEHAHDFRLLLDTPVTHELQRLCVESIVEAGLIAPAERVSAVHAHVNYTHPDLEGLELHHMIAYPNHRPFPKEALVTTLPVCVVDSNAKLEEDSSDPRDGTTYKLLKVERTEMAG